MSATIEEWLVAQGLAGPPTAEIIQGFCARLVTGGFPLARGVIGSRILHPQFGAVSLIWRRGEGEVEIDLFHHDQTDDFATSPFARLARGADGGTMRRRLCDPDCPHDFPLLDRLVEAGMTDYFCAVVPLGESSATNRLYSSWATDRAGGFAEAELAYLAKLLPLLAVVVKATTAPRVARRLLSLYLGQDAGDRVLAGTIQRGSMQSIRAVLCYADLAGFTRFAETNTGPALVATLNRYLEAIAVPITRRRGQVLKFLGDGLLATFALADFSGETEGAVAAALDAAEEALTRVAALKAEREASGEAALDVDIALHLGDVLYGNVGTEDRLDFTVVGPAVNEANRIETLCQALGRRVLASAAVADAAGAARQRLERIGHFVLRGVREPQLLFGLAQPPSPAR
jgi:adenylate cyclase